MINKSLPFRSRLSLRKLHGGGWVCLVLDFYGTIIATCEGETRDEARSNARVERDKYLASIRGLAVSNTIPKGRKWTAAWRISAEKLAQVRETARKMLDTVHHSPLTSGNA